MAIRRKTQCAVSARCEALPNGTELIVYALNAKDPSCTKPRNKGFRFIDRNPTASRTCNRMLAETPSLTTTQEGVASILQSDSSILPSPGQASGKTKP